MDPKTFFVLLNLILIQVFTTVSFKILSMIPKGGSKSDAVELTVRVTQTKNNGKIFIGSSNSTVAILIPLLSKEQNVTRDLNIPKLRREAYASQNCYRGLHGANPLQTSSTLEDFADQWANHLAGSGGNLQHSNSQYGENLYAGSQLQHGWEPVQAWYDEVSSYDFNDDNFQPSGGHFSQLVWKGSTSTGISFAQGGGWIVCVAEYDPPGNSGNYIQNVSPLVSGSPSDCTKGSSDSSDSSPDSNSPGPSPPCLASRDSPILPITLNFNFHSNYYNEDGKVTTIQNNV